VFPVSYEHHLHIKSKAIPITVHGGLYDSEMLRIPHCLAIGSEMAFVILTHRSRFTHRKYYFFASGTHFRGGRSVGIGRSRTKGHGVCLFW
jgi:hypothetical protein